MSFNLSILECKYIIDNFMFSPFHVLIYPYWNVNDTNAITVISNNASFNLSILECKYFLLYYYYYKFHVLIYPYWNVNIQQILHLA